MSTSTFGFIMIRHINSDKTNEYWKRCYESIRRHHPDTKIIIIDDNSDPTYLNHVDYPLTNCEFIVSEFPGRGELLPYYYYYHHKFFDRAIILHDSMFLNASIDVETIRGVDRVLFLWHFEHQWDYTVNPQQIIESSILRFKYPLLLFRRFIDRWVGCFGGCSIISHDFLKTIFEKYNFVDLINHVKTRNSRCCFERIFALICHFEWPALLQRPSLLGRMEYYMNPYTYFLSYDQYLEKEKELAIYPIIKVWSGR